MKPVVLVTGATGGIGEAICRRFAQGGYAVAVHYRHQAEKAEALVKALLLQVPAMAVQCDLTDSAQVDAMVQAVRQKLGMPTVLVNNAGIAAQQLIIDVTDAAWHRMMGVHLDGAFYASRAVLPAMISEKSGSIVNVASMWGVVGASCEVAYSAAKAGLIGFTRALAQEVGPSGIRVNAVAPGLIDTPMNGNLDPETIRAICEETPLGIMGTPEDVAEAVWFMAHARFITGEVLNVNGGLVIG